MIDTMNVFNISCSSDMFMRTTCSVELTDESITVFYILIGWNILVITRKMLRAI